MSAFDWLYVGSGFLLTFIALVILILAEWKSYPGNMPIDHDKEG